MKQNIKINSGSSGRVVLVVVEVAVVVVVSS